MIETWIKKTPEGIARLGKMFRWMRILPPQRRMIAAAAKGEPFDATLAAGAKERSKHNTFLAIPTTFIMISNHFPTATYGNHYAVPILGVLILVGWTAAALLRRA